MIIKKIFDGNFDDEIHNQFVKFSRGEFKDKYLIDAKKQASKWAVKTGPEFVNHFVLQGLKSLNGEIAVKGIIVSTLDLKDEIKFDIDKVSSRFSSSQRSKVFTVLSFDHNASSNRQIHSSYFAVLIYQNYIASNKFFSKRQRKRRKRKSISSISYCK